MQYINNLVTRFWRYRHEAFAQQDQLFDRNLRAGNRPPVFHRAEAIHNVLLAPGLDPDQQAVVRSKLPESRRHRWFRSMRSSQSLAQSIFGNLDALGMLSCLSRVTSDLGEHPFDVACHGLPTVELEHQVNYLGEDPRRCTSVDVLFHGKRRVYTECKLAEDGVGHCSRPKLGDQDPDHCNGNYQPRLDRQYRCPLSARGIAYWQHIPALFRWEDIDHVPCPVRVPYQLVRNVLAACVQPDGTVDTAGVFVVLLIDNQNPAFQENGDGRQAFETVRRALREPGMLHWCTWQDVVAAMRQDMRMAGFAGEIHNKYGF